MTAPLQVTIHLKTCVDRSDDACQYMFLPDALHPALRSSSLAVICLV